MSNYFAWKDTDLDKMERIKEKLEDFEKEHKIKNKHTKKKSNVGSIRQDKSNYQPFYLEHNGIKVEVQEVKITHHGYKRIKERIGVKNSDEAKKSIRRMLKKAVKIGEVIAEDGNKSVLFAYKRNGIHLSTDLKRIVTVVRIHDINYTPIKDQLIDLHQKELRKLTRREKQLINYLEEQKRLWNIEIAELEYKKYKSKSIAKQNAYQAMINGYKDTVRDIEKEIKEVQDNVRRVSNSMVSII